MPTSQAALIRSALHAERNRCLEAWEQSLHYHAETSAHPELRQLLGSYLDQLATPPTLELPDTPHLAEMLPISVREEACLLLVGEEAVATVLRDVCAVADEEWLVVRRELARLFHTLLRTIVRRGTDHGSFLWIHSPEAN
jgi:hypothetical protein